MNGVAPIDTGYIRQSAAEIGNVLKDAVNAQMQEVNDIMAVQAQTVQATATYAAAGDMIQGGVNLLA